MRDQAFERQSPSFDQPNQSRNVDMRHRVAAVGASQHFVEMDWQRVDRNLFARHADQHASAVGMGEIIGKLDHRFHAGGLDNLVGTFDADDLADLRVQVCHRVAIETMGGAAALRHAELGINQIDGNDWIGSGEISELHDIEADATDAKYHHRLANLDV